MRLGADHDRGGGVLVIALSLAFAASTGACSKTWVLDATPGAGGMAASGSGGGVGGAVAPSGTGGLPGFGGHGDQGTGGRDACTFTMPLQYSNLPADLIFVVGRNNSMSTKFGDSTRMTAVQMDVHNIVASNQINFGYQDFPSFTGCSSGGTCCPSADDGFAPTATSNIDNVLYHPCDANSSGMGCVAQTDSRAVSQSLNAAFELFGSTDPSSDRYVVLMTDGPPGCPTEDPGTACGNAQAQVSMLAKFGIKTYVVAIGDDATGDSCLQQLASQGGTAMPSSATDSASLMRALSQIANVASVTCTFELKVPPPYPSQVEVQLLSGKEIHYDVTGNTGWSYVSGRIQLHGAACTALQTSRSQQVTIWSGCPPCTVPSATCL